ncbi:MAG: ATP-binding protein [Chloracidobacterium sp.]|nr:ATP-binding protein [Chloracidobacterium sp.]
MQQVVWKLLSNAVKFTNEGGRIEVRLERVARMSRSPSATLDAALTRNFYLAFSIVISRPRSPAVDALQVWGWDPAGETTGRDAWRQPGGGE